MKTKERKQYTAEFKAQAVELMAAGKPVAELTRTLSMPEFSTTLLTMMGINSGVYLGFKMPEGKAAPPPPVAGNENAG